MPATTTPGNSTVLGEPKRPLENSTKARPSWQQQNRPTCVSNGYKLGRDDEALVVLEATVMGVGSSRAQTLLDAIRAQAKA
jgi:hypothetical protein